MSLRIGRSIGNVWDVVVEDKYVKANLSTAQKDSREESGYRHMSWHTRFVGDAYEKAKTLTNKTRIEIPDGDAKIENTKSKRHITFLGISRIHYPCNKKIFTSLIQSGIRPNLEFHAVDSFFLLIFFIYRPRIPSKLIVVFCCFKNAYRRNNTSFTTARIFI